MAIKKHPDAVGFQNTRFTAVPGKGYVDETLDHRMPYVLVCGWNSTTLEPEIIDISVINTELANIEDALLGSYWKDERYDYNGENTVYIGKHTTMGTATAVATWNIWKLTYNVASQITRKQGPLMGAWDNRAALGW